MSNLRLTPEDNLQAACFTWFRLQYPGYKRLYYAVPNGGKRHKVTAVKLKLTGVVSGVADTFLSIPRGGLHGLYIEFKIGRNTLTENQLIFKQDVELLDYGFAVVYDLVEFTKVVTDYLNLKPS